MRVEAKQEVFADGYGGGREGGGKVECWGEIDAAVDPATRDFNLMVRRAAACFGHA